MPRTPSPLEAEFALCLRALKIAHETEYEFAKPARNWRFDFALLEYKIAVECQGGIYSGGAHNRGAYMTKEYEKLNYATALGWRVFFVSPKRTSAAGTAAVSKQIQDIITSEAKQ